MEIRIAVGIFIIRNVWMAAQVDDRFASRIPHTGLDTANQLVNGIRNGSLIRHAALNAFSNKFLFAVGIFIIRNVWMAAQKGPL